MKKPSPAQTETLLRLVALADTPHNLDAMQYVVFQFDFREYEQFIIECPPGSIRFNNVLRAAVFCDTLGYLVETEAVARESIYELFPIPWAKVEPIIQGMRRELDWPDAFDYFERLGQDYLKWWEAKRKKLKPLPPAPQPVGAPRSLTVPRPRPALPARPQAPPRPAVAPPRPVVTAPQAPARPAASQAPARGPVPPAAAAAPAPGPKPGNKPTLRILAKPVLKLAAKPLKVVKKAGSPSRPAARPASHTKPTPRSDTGRFMKR